LIALLVSMSMGITPVYDVPRRGVEASNVSRLDTLEVGARLEAFHERNLQRVREGRRPVRTPSRLLADSSRLASTRLGRTSPPEARSSRYEWFLLLGIVYLLPSFVAQYRRHRSRYSILVLDLFLGWTVIGWIEALRWAWQENGGWSPVEGDHDPSRSDSGP
jgi:hypothetical protein